MSTELTADFMALPMIEHNGRTYVEANKALNFTTERVKQAALSVEQQAFDALKIHDWIEAEIVKACINEAGAFVTSEDAQRIAADAVMRVLQDKATLITVLADSIHAMNCRAGWWTDLSTNEDLHGKRNVGELLMLCVSELAEAMEGHRKNLMDDHLPAYPMMRVEVIDCMIRCLDLLGSDREAQRTQPAGEIFMAKVNYNASRADHRPENRRLADGKKF